jgi:hypothetical protein
MRSLFRPLVFFALLISLPGCATLQGFMALSQVRFEVDGISEVRLAGIDVAAIRSFEDLSVLDALRVTQALSSGRVPLSFTLDLSAANPSGNPEARLVALDWTLLLGGRETVSGSLPEPLRFASGTRTPFDVQIALDLREFFDGGARDLVNVALGIAGVGGEAVDVRLRAIPTLETPIGPIRYPEPLTLIAREGSRRLGSDHPIPRP